MEKTDEKYLLYIKKCQKSAYGNYVPFDVISHHFLWIKAPTVSLDLQNLASEGYLSFIDVPSVGFWYLLTEKGNRECYRIKDELKDKRNTFFSECLKAIIVAGITLVIERLFL